MVVDTWTGRHIERIPITEPALSRARAFARAGHPALQQVLRIDRSDGSLWLEAPVGRPLDRALRASQRAALAAAIGALHAAGGVHGRIDAEHILIEGDAPVLRFHATADPTATADRDWLALSRL
jgi:serine/threonine-protein kinase